MGPKETKTLSYRVAFSRRAAAHLGELHSYIAEKAGERIAEYFVSGIQQFCLDLANFPHRGTRRESTIPALRILGYKSRATIAFTVDDNIKVVTVLGVYYRGRNVGNDLNVDTLGE